MRYNDVPDYNLDPPEYMDEEEIEREERAREEYEDRAYDEYKEMQLLMAGEFDDPTGWPSRAFKAEAGE